MRRWIILMYMISVPAGLLVGTAAYVLFGVGGGPESYGYI